MAQQHTKGLWRVRYSGSFGSIIVDPENAPGVIASMVDRETETETLANAYLIAAAPTLLEELQQANQIIASLWVKLQKPTRSRSAGQTARSQN